MSVHPVLTMSVYVGASVVFALVLLSWFLYTRHLRTPRNTGKNEGIAIPTQRKEREDRSGTIDRAA